RPDPAGPLLSAAEIRSPTADRASPSAVRSANAGLRSKPAAHPEGRAADHYRGPASTRRPRCQSAGALDPSSSVSLQSPGPGPGSTVDHTAWPRCDAIDPHQWDPSASRKGERSRPLPFRPLAAQTQALDQLTVAVDVLLLHVLEKAAAPADHQQQAAAAVVVVLVRLEVLGELGDAVRQQRDLHVGRPGVAVAGAVLGDDLLLGGGVDRHSAPFPLCSVRVLAEPLPADRCGAQSR